MGEPECMPIYKFCYGTNRDINAWAAYECCKKRSTSENWITPAKKQLFEIGSLPSERDDLLDLL